MHGVRSGYWRDTFEGRQWLFTKSGLTEATKGYDIKQVVIALKEVGMLELDSEGKSTTHANFKTNETGNNRFYVIKFTEQDCNAQKQGGTGGTKENKEPLLSTTCTTDTTEKTPNTNQLPENNTMPLSCNADNTNGADSDSDSDSCEHF